MVVAFMVVQFLKEQFRAFPKPFYLSTSQCYILFGPEWPSITRSSVRKSVCNWKRDNIVTLLLSLFLCFWAHQEQPTACDDQTTCVICFGKLRSHSLLLVTGRINEEEFQLLVSIHNHETIEKQMYLYSSSHILSRIIHVAGRYQAKTRTNVGLSSVRSFSIYQMAI